MISENTYQELYEILSLMDKATVMKVPIDILNTIKEQRNTKYQTRINKKDIFNENNVNKETIDLLCYLDYHYWMSEDKKAEVDRIKQQMIQDEEQEKRKKYSPDDIFKNIKEDKGICQEITESSNDVFSLMGHKESFFIKLKKFIFKVLHIDN